MHLRSPCKYLELAPRAIRILIAIALLIAPALAAKTATLTGVIFTVGSDHVQTLWPNARVTLKNLDTKNETATTSDSLGTYVFSSVRYGQYEISVVLAGFEQTTRRLTIDGNAATKIDIRLIPRQQTETVTISAEESGVNLTSSSGGAPALNEKLLKSLVERNQDFQDALPLLPGVVRGPDGLIRIKGGRTNQTNTLVNSASVTDTFTGQPALSLPAVAIPLFRCFPTPFHRSTGSSPAAWSTWTRAAARTNGSGSLKIPYRDFAGSITDIHTESKVPRLISLSRVHS